MLLFNFKLFFKIAAAILSGTSVSNPDSSSADSIIKSETLDPKIETVQLKDEQKSEFKLKDISVDSLGLYLDTPKPSKEYKSVIVEK